MLLLTFIKLRENTLLKGSPCRKCMGSVPVLGKDIEKLEGEYLF